MKNHKKVMRVSQCHLEIGAGQRQAIMEKYVDHRQPPIKYFSQLTEAELDTIIAAIDEAIEKQARLVIITAEPKEPTAAEPVTVQVSFW